MNITLLNINWFVCCVNFQLDKSRRRDGRNAPELPTMLHFLTHLQQDNTKHRNFLHNYFYFAFDVHVTMHRDKFLTIKPNGRTNFSNLFLDWNSTCFGQFLCPSSGVFHCTHGTSWSCPQAVSTTCMTYTCTIAVCVCSEKLLVMDRGAVRNM